MSAFIRKMVLNGYMIIPEWPELKGVLSLHSRISNNLNQYAKLPKCLVEDEGFVELSMDAKLLYAFFLDRVSLSIKNGWIDNQPREGVYLLFNKKLGNCETRDARSQT